jgi:hypothetical protein
MQLWNNLTVISLLGLISMAGIVAMLLLNGIWDILMLLITALPLFVALYRALKLKKND